MIKKKLFALALIVSVCAAAQEARLKIHVTDKITAEALELSSIVVENSGNTVASGVADVNGELVLHNLLPGTYNVKAAYVGYPKKIISGVAIKNNETTYLDIILSSENIIGEFVLTDYVKPLIDPNTSSKITFSLEEIKRSPLDIMSLISNGTGAVVKEEGMSPSFHGARPNSNVILIDGQRVIGSASLPRMGVQQISVTLGGIPAMYGDGTGGFIEIETRSGLVNPKN